MWRKKIDFAFQKKKKRIVCPHGETDDGASATYYIILRVYSGTDSKPRKIDPSCSV